MYGFIASADHFSECVESHAFETYDKFIKVQGGIMEFSFPFSFLCYLDFYSMFNSWFYAFVIEVWKTIGFIHARES